MINSKVILLMIIYFLMYSCSTLEKETDRLFWAEDSVYIEGLEIKATPISVYDEKGKFTLQIKNNRGHDSVLAFRNLDVCGFNTESSAIYVDVFLSIYTKIRKDFYVIPAEGIDINVYISRNIKFIQHPNITLCIYKETEDAVLVQSLEASLSDRSRWIGLKK